MADERGDLVSAKFIHTKARDKQTLGEPGAKGWMFQPGKELAASQDNRGRYLMYGNPLLLVDEG
jgi:hypothetical protein